MRTRVALAQSRDGEGTALTLAAYAVPLHTIEESYQEGEKDWQLFIREAAPCLRARVTSQFSSRHGYLLTFSPTGRYLAAGLGGETLALWNSQTGQALPPCVISGLEDYVFVSEEQHGGSPQVRILCAGQHGLTDATFSGGQWEIALKETSVPLRCIALSAATGQVALSDATLGEPTIWALSTLLSPSTRRLDRRTSSDPEPVLVYTRSTHQPLLWYPFTPSGSHLLLRYGCGELTLRSTRDPRVILPLAHPEHAEYLGYRDSHRFPDVPMTFSDDGRRLVARAGFGLLFWERETQHAPFSRPRYVHSGWESSSEHAALGFTNEGDPVGLTPLGERAIYDWAKGSWSRRAYLGFTEEVLPELEERADGAFPCSAERRLSGEKKA